MTDMTGVVRDAQNCYALLEMVEEIKETLQDAAYKKMVEKIAELKKEMQKAEIYEVVLLKTEVREMRSEDVAAELNFDITAAPLTLRLPRDSICVCHEEWTDAELRSRLGQPVKFIKGFIHMSDDEDCSTGRKQLFGSNEECGGGGYPLHVYMDYEPLRLLSFRKL
jgi:hypothetical protein